MKRFISLLCMLLLLPSFTLNFSALTYPTEYTVSVEKGASASTSEFYNYGYIGDSDYSHSITIKDATTIQKHLANLLTLKDTNLLLSDVDFSNSVNIKDATVIQKWLAGINVEFPVYHLLSDSYDKATNHYHAYTIKTRPATCTENGGIIYTCSCGEVYTTNEVVSSGHNWTDNTTPKTCTICGATDDSTLDVPGKENYHGHVYTGGSSSKKYHYEETCAGKYSHEITWDEVAQRGLDPCGTCVLK